MSIRAALFRALLRRFGENTPGLVLRAQLQILLNATAEGFGRSRVSIWHRKPKEALRAYGAFTRACMNDPIPGTEERLYHTAYRLGTMLRRITGFTRDEDIRQLVFFLYKGIGIDMAGSLPGEITVSRCYFSRIYSPAQCGYISAMDRGIIAGLFGGGELCFTCRLTEGCGCCKAKFKKG